MPSLCTRYVNGIKADKYIYIHIYLYVCICMGQRREGLYFKKIFFMQMSYFFPSKSLFFTSIVGTLSWMKSCKNENFECLCLHIKKTEQSNCYLRFFKTELFLECFYVPHNIAVRSEFTSYYPLLFVVFVQLNYALYVFMEKCFCPMWIVFSLYTVSAHQNFTHITFLNSPSINYLGSE